MKEVLNLYKKIGETPLQTLNRFVASYPEYRGVKMTYAGRLDPMAEGVLIVLSGSANKDRVKYTGLDKDYEFDFILGVDTDTHDLLGKVVGEVRPVKIGEAEVRETLSRYRGEFEQYYPAYSSKVVAGIQLFDYARRGKITSIILPKHKVRVDSIELVGSRSVSRDEWWQEIRSTIDSVEGDFRQEEIISIWEKTIPSLPNKLTIYRARVSCGSGFYVRQLVADIGRDLSTGAVTARILRTRVGDYRINDSMKID